MVRNVLYEQSIPVNDAISIRIPTVGEVLECEDLYYNMVYLITSTPYDVMAQLDEMGLDFTKMNDFDLFFVSFGVFQDPCASLIFGDLDLSRLQTAFNPQNELPILIDVERGVVIDRAIHDQICTALRKVHHLKRNPRKPGNKEAKDFLLERAKIKLKRQRERVEESQLEELIVAMVNTEQFKYNFETVREMSIYRFNESVHQVIKSMDVRDKRQAIFTGNLSVKDVKDGELNWLTNK